MGFEPTTPFGAPDFESGRWPVRLPSSGFRSMLVSFRPFIKIGPIMPRATNRVHPIAAVAPKTPAVPVLAHFAVRRAQVESR